MGKVINSVSPGEWAPELWHTAGTAQFGDDAVPVQECGPQAGDSSSDSVSLSLQQAWEERVGLSLTPPTAYAKGIRDMENSYILKCQNSISSSGQPQP